MVAVMAWLVTREFDIHKKDTNFAKHTNTKTLPQDLHVAKRRGAAPAACANKDTHMTANPRVGKLKASPRRGNYL